MLTVSDVRRTRDVVGKVVVSSNCDPQVILATKSVGRFGELEKRHN